MTNMKSQLSLVDFLMVLAPRIYLFYEKINEDNIMIPITIQFNFDLT